MKSKKRLSRPDSIDDFICDKFIKGAIKAIPNYEEIKVSHKDKLTAEEIYRDFLDTGGLENKGDCENCSTDHLNIEIMSIIEEMKKKYPDANWDIIQKPIYDKIYSGLT